MKIRIFILLILLCAGAAGAEGVSASLLYKVQLGEHSVPADVVINADGTAGVYDAADGSYTLYRGGKSVSSVVKNHLKGGNCLTYGGNYFLFCNKEKGSVEMLASDMSVFQSFRPSEKPKFDPTDAYASGGFLFAVDNDGHRVLKFDMSTGKQEKEAGKYGQEKLAFWYPYSIAVDAKGILYISEVLNTRVQKITQELKFYEFVGSWGVAGGQFFRPTGIAVYKGDTLFVADGFTGVIQYTDSEGRFKGALKDKFQSVTHIRINGNKLAVVDGYARTVYVIELGG